MKWDLELELEVGLELDLDLGLDFYLEVGGALGPGVGVTRWKCSWTWSWSLELALELKTWELDAEGGKTWSSNWNGNNKGLHCATQSAGLKFLRIRPPELDRPPFGRWAWQPVPTILSRPLLVVADTANGLL